jgi:peptidoglycan/LPS O-acetylase OafA/YrhL
VSQPTSFFLDVLRVVAALTVFFYHCVLFWYPDQVEGLVGHLGHRAVIIFFVLSGYVIAHATWRRETSLRAYAVARLSRLYSVVLPALILTALLAWTGSHLNPSAYASFIHPHATARYFLTAFFLQSLWMLNAAPPTNGPFWSCPHGCWAFGFIGKAAGSPSPKPRQAAAWSSPSWS